MLHSILVALDENRNGNQFAVIASLIDWKEAFPRQCHKLGIEAFINLGVRKSLIPTLISFFQDRRMAVKWHGKLSEIKKLNGSGPQGSTIGLLEYLAQSNDNANCVDVEKRFKFIDDLTILEIVNLITIGISSYNSKLQVPNDIPDHNGYIDPNNLLSQKHINDISQWTRDHKMKLNQKKSNIMIFNFTKTKQFTTRLTMNDCVLPVVRKMKLLGTIICDDLKWDENTTFLIKKANSRLLLLRKATQYTNLIEDLRSIYLSHIRVILEQSCAIWHSTITQENIDDLERVQKNACRIILGNKYIGYDESLKYLNLDK